LLVLVTLPISSWPGHSRSKNGVASLAYGRSKNGVASLAYGPAIYVFKPALPLGR